MGVNGPIPASTNEAQITVTVRPSGQGVPPALSPHDIRVYENHQSRPVVALISAQELTGPLDLTILLDDSIRPQVGLQFQDIRDFFPKLPAGARVRIGYASFGGSRVVQDFTGDYNLAAAALRTPVGSTVAGGSIYDSVTQMLKTWPDTRRRRELLVISDGIDIHEGFAESDPTQNTDLRLAIRQAQRMQIPVYSIYEQGVPTLSGNWYLMDNGQSCLLQLSRKTGGQAFFQGTHAPLDFAACLKQFARDLRNQYILTFRPLAAKHGYQSVRVSTETPNVRLLAPQRVFIPKTG